jgi:hypothetical protein
MSQLFKLKTYSWYAWQMLPGYDDTTYFSPIFVQSVTPLKSGNNRLKLQFINAMYAVGAKDFEFDLQIVRRMPSHLIADLSDGDRTAIISEINFGWIERFTPNLLKRGGTNNVPPPFKSDIQYYLSAYFTEDPENHIKEKEEAQRA